MRLSYTDYFKCNGFNSGMVLVPFLWDYHTLTGNEMCVKVKRWVSPTSWTLGPVTNQSMRYIRHFFLFLQWKCFISLVILYDHKRTLSICTWHSTAGTLKTDCVQVISEMADGGVDYSFECTGISDVLREAFLSTHDVSCVFLFHSQVPFLANTVANWPTNNIARNIIWPS